MRNNQPVTSHEIELQSDTIIVSKTNLKGQIVYVNKDFLDVSGFVESELIGEPHNIVRHPDMPEQAFADMWSALKAGRPWIGMVKNRCKNGDYYWVEAHATPIYENDSVIGYMSVRRKPRRDQVEAATQAYALFKSGNASGLAIQNGAVVSTSVRARVGRWLRDFSLRQRLMTQLAIILAFMIAIAGALFFVIEQDHQALFSLYEKRVMPIETSGRIIDLMGFNRGELLTALGHDPANKYSKLHDHPVSKHTDVIRKNIAEVTRLITVYESKLDGSGRRVITPEHELLLASLKKSRQSFVVDGLQPAISLIEAGRYEEANAVRKQFVDPGYQAARSAFEGLLNYQQRASERDYAQAVATMDQLRIIVVILVVLSIVIALVLAILTIRALQAPLNVARSTFLSIGQGRYDSAISVARNDELGKVLQGLEAMQTRMGFEVAEARRQSDEMTRIKIALDNAGTPFRIADEAGTVVYANQRMIGLLRKIEPAVKDYNPTFTVDSFVGGSVASVMQNPADYLTRLSALSSASSNELVIGGRTFDLTTTPVLNASGRRLGTVGEWVDRTDQVVIEREVAEIVTGAVKGDFTQRLSLDGKQGFFLALGQGMNQLLETSERGLNDVAEVLQALSRGDLTQQIAGDYHGLFGQLQDDANGTVERLKEVVLRIKDATDAINTAAQEIAAGNADLSSRTEQQASSLEETASSMEELNATVRQNAENAKQANELANSSNELASRGGEMVQRVVSTMGDIQDSSKKIADIIGVIDSIAFQTNILALNAAVEAARAGEQGRGFAVVASEVRSLAQRSATAAKEIKGLIAESVDKVEGGAKLVQEAGATMKDVVTSFSKVAALVTDISNASREQSAGIEQVTQAVGQMDEVTQQNAALVEEAAAAAESLEDQARGLVQAVSTFKLDEGADQNHLPAPALRDATPRQLRGEQSAARRPQRSDREPSTRAPVRQVSLSPQGAEDEWKEF